MSLISILFVYLPLVQLINGNGDINKLNIVLIVADDLGWNDVGFHGSEQIPTPNIDMLASSGVVLNRLYSHSVCTPSRAAIMTGKFAHKTGMQGYPLTNGEERGLPLSEKILPEYLQELGYSTHLVGKWHLGFHQHKYLPTFRGFDSHYGHRGGFIDYYEYTAEEEWVTGKVSGLDMFRNVTADWNAEGYVTDLYNNEARNIIKSHNVTKPLFLMLSHLAPHNSNDGALLQAPPEAVRQMRHVESPERRVYAAMVKKLDGSVGDIVETLQEKGILRNTLIVFISDNGGPTITASENWSSNVPLRGQKMTPWEGGIRVAGLMWTPQLIAKNNVWDGYMHAVDWLPTLLGSVGTDLSEEIDGIDQWNNILESKSSQRKEIFEIDDTTKFYAIIVEEYKLVLLDGVEANDYYGRDLNGVIGEVPSYIENIRNSKVYRAFKDIGIAFNETSLNVRFKAMVNCNNKISDGSVPVNGKKYLFNIQDDPCEKVDISGEHIDIVQRLWNRLYEEINNRKPREFPVIRDPRARPNHFNYTWTTWDVPKIK